MHTASPTVIAIDGLPASPAMAAALAKIAASCDASKAASTSRQARLDADPRIIQLRAAKAALTTPLADGMVGALQVFADMGNGRSARRARIAALIRARVQMLDGFPHVARVHLREAAVIRRQSPRAEALTAPVVAGAVNLGAEIKARAA